jgi:hypothetical protein
MATCLENRGTQINNADGEVSVVVDTNNQSCLDSRRMEYHINTEHFIWLELSMVREVEYVFVERTTDDSFSVLTIVNERDPEIREKIYAREQAIIDAHPKLYFDFHVVPRMNRALSDIAGAKQKPYRRIAA